MNISCIPLQREEMVENGRGISRSMLKGGGERISVTVYFEK